MNDFYTLWILQTRLGVGLRQKKDADLGLPRLFAAIYPKKPSVLIAEVRSRELQQGVSR